MNTAPPASGIPREPDTHALLAHRCQPDLQNIVGIHAGPLSFPSNYIVLTEVRAALPTREAGAHARLLAIEVASRSDRSPPAARVS